MPCFKDFLIQPNLTLKIVRFQFLVWENEIRKTIKCQKYIFANQSYFLQDVGKISVRVSGKTLCKSNGQVDTNKIIIYSMIQVNLTNGRGDLQNNRILHNIMLAKCTERTMKIKGDTMINGRPRILYLDISVPLRLAQLIFATVLYKTFHNFTYSFSFGTGW